ncbi:hypothetical protein VTJ49DRAFT_3173 [Mycothermus thermophilus]|uniref:Uncharacterized protein n=1 Tax=Humicola insolens TaxID=85995 RepID=A0ABR3V892_HUMIN
MIRPKRTCHSRLEDHFGAGIHFHPGFVVQANRTHGSGEGNPGPTRRGGAPEVSGDETTTSDDDDGGGVQQQRRPPGPARSGSNVSQTSDFQGQI